MLAMTEHVYAKHCSQAMGASVDMLSGDRLKTDGVPRARGPGPS